MPVRPPRKWFYECVDANQDKDDPEAFCGWLWHHWMTPGAKRRALRRGERRYDPKDLWRSFPAKLLWIPQARAGLRRGKQAFTDLVEAVFEVPARIYDRLLKEGYFAEYDKGLAARRGRSRRGTNIFIRKRR